MFSAVSFGQGRQDVRQDALAGGGKISPYCAVEARGQRPDNPDLQHDWSPSGGRSRMLNGSRLRLNSLGGNWRQKTALVSSRSMNTTETRRREGAAPNGGLFGRLL